MKQFYILIFALAISHNINSQTVYKTDSSLQYTWGGSDWDLVGRVLYTFDNGGNKETKRLTQSFNNPNYEDVLDVISEYNNSNNLTRATSRTWNGTTMQWDGFSKTEHDYDEDQNISETREYSLAVSPTLDVVFIQVNFTYNEDNLETEQIWKTYDFMSMMLMNSTRTTTSYNAMNTRAEEQILYIWDGMSWEETIKLNYFYEGLKLIRVEETPWDMGAWAIMPNKQTLYAYNGSDMPISTITQEWIGGGWVNQFGVFTTYSGNITVTTTQEWNTGINMWDDVSRSTTTVTGLVTVLLEEEWNTGTAMWDEESKTTITLDANGNIIEAINEVEPPVSGRALEKSTKITFVWSEATSLSVAIEDIANVKIYPNPFKSIITLSFHNPLKSDGYINLYDITGKVLAKKLVRQGDSKIEFKLPEIAQGAYFIDIATGETRGHYKVVKN